MTKTFLAPALTKDRVMPPGPGPTSTTYLSLTFACLAMESRILGSRMKFCESAFLAWMLYIRKMSVALVPKDLGPRMGIRCEMKMIDEKRSATADISYESSSVLGLIDEAPQRQWGVALVPKDLGPRMGIRCEMKMIDEKRSAKIILKKK